MLDSNLCTVCSAAKSRAWLFLSTELPLTDQVTPLMLMTKSMDETRAGEAWQVVVKK